MDGLKSQLACRLRELGIIEHGDFALSGGDKSSRYFNVKKILGYPEIRKQIVNVIRGNFSPYNVRRLVGAGYGSIPIITDLSKIYDIRMSAFRSERKDHGTATELEYCGIDRGDVCVIFDDVGTSYKTIKSIDERIKAVGGKTKEAHVIVDRSSEKHEYRLGKEGLGFPVKSVFDSEDLI